MKCKINLFNLVPYCKNAYKEVYIDRGMLVTDFFLATIIPYIIQFMLWSWFFNSAELNEFNGYQYKTLMVYYVFVIAFNRLNNGYGIVEYYSSIAHSGSLSSLACKPISLANQRLADFIGGSALYCLPVVIAYFVHVYIAQVDLLSAVIGLAKLFIVMLFSQILCFYVSYFFAIFTLVLYRPHFLLNLLSAFQIIFGGVLIPYNFWPEYLHMIMKLNPFYFIIAAPVEVIIGTYNEGILHYCMITLAYIVVLRVITSVLENHLVKRSSILGG